MQAGCLILAGPESVLKCATLYTDVSGVLSVCNVEQASCPHAGNMKRAHGKLLLHV